MAEARSAIQMNEAAFQNRIAMSNRRSWHARLRHMKGLCVPRLCWPHGGSFAECQRPLAETPGGFSYLSTAHLTALCLHDFSKLSTGKANLTQFNEKKKSPTRKLLFFLFLKKLMSGMAQSDTRSPWRGAQHHLVRAQGKSVSSEVSAFKQRAHVVHRREDFTTAPKPGLAHWPFASCRKWRPRLATAILTSDTLPPLKRLGAGRRGCSSSLATSFLEWTVYKRSRNTISCLRHGVAKTRSQEASEKYPSVCGISKKRIPQRSGSQN